MGRYKVDGMSSMDGLRDLDVAATPRRGSAHSGEVHPDEVCHDAAEETEGVAEPPPRKDGGGGREPKVLLLRLLRSAGGGPKPRDGSDPWVPTEAAVHPSGGREPRVLVAGTDGSTTEGRPAVEPMDGKDAWEATDAAAQASGGSEPWVLVAGTEGSARESRPTASSMPAGAPALAPG